jgi:NAD(P)-dependent dehydrogenase (short-subunit alcohol dehydrogenase family)
MTTTPSTAVVQRPPELPGQTVVIIGGSAGIGLETARRARAEGAEVILGARSQGRLRQAAAEVGASRTAAFDATDPSALERFFAGLSTPVDHVMVTGPGPYYAPLAELDREQAHRTFDAHQWLAIEVAQLSVGRVRPGGTLLFMGDTAGRSRGPGLSFIAAATAAMPALIANLAVEIAPIRVNLIAPGFVNTPLSASLLGDNLEARRAQLRAALPIGRVVGPDDVAALAVHIMINTALTGATYDVDGGQQLNQQRLGHAQRPDVQRALLEQGAGDRGGDERVHRPVRQHATNARDRRRLRRRLEE